MNLIRHNETFEQIFQEHNEVIGKDLERYRGHCYRLLNYINYWKLTEEELKLCEVAIPFHDIGIWTSKTMNYLDPSFEAAKKYVRKNNLNIDEAILENMIVSHHKISTIKNNSMAEKLRKADLIDLTFGAIRFGIPQKKMRSISEAFPNHGFQKNIYGKVFSHAIRHLGNPFPMLKF